MGHPTHTTGPWRTGIPGKGRFVVYSAAPGEHGRAICLMRNTQAEPAHPLNALADANARLIAKAPELVEALRDMVCTPPCETNDGTAHPWCDRARTLLREVEGA